MSAEDLAAALVAVDEAERRYRDLHAQWLEARLAIEPSASAEADALLDQAEEQELEHAQAARGAAGLGKGKGRPKPPSQFPILGRQALRFTAASRPRSD